jgi:ribonuclease Z
MKAIILGTASAFPTKERAHSAMLLDIGTESLLFDAGESVQRQIQIAGERPFKISKIFLTHWHGDHVLGLGGLLQSFGMLKRRTPVEIFGPKGTFERFQHLRKALELRIGFPVKIIEIPLKTIKIIETDKYEIWAAKAKHDIDCLAFAYVEKPKRRIDVKYLKKFNLVNNPVIGKLADGKDIVWKGKKIFAKKATYMQPGKKLTYIIDSAYAENLINFSKNSDLLVCEATFTNEMKAEAKEYGHMTAADAATIAKKAHVKKLVITHFSQRYKTSDELLKEAKKIFPNTIAAKDFMQFDI